MKNKDNMVEYGLLSRYRKALLGLAMLSIMFFHSQIGVNKILFYVKEIGYGGADVFVFLSGFGIFYSLKKNEDIKDFYKRRAWKIIPVYLPFILMWLCYTRLNKGIGIKEVLGNVTFTGIMAGIPNQFNWFIQAIVLFYFVSPCIYALIKNKKKYILILCAFCLLSSVSFVGYRYKLMIVIRMVTFIIGMYYGMQSYNRNNLSKKTIAELGLGSFLGITCILYLINYNESLLWKYGIWWYPFIIIVPFICLMSSVIFDKITKIKLGRILVKIFEWIGDNSFEIYLIHIWAFSYCVDNNYINHNYGWILLGLGCILVSYLYGLLIHFCKTKILNLGEKDE